MEKTEADTEREQARDDRLAIRVQGSCFMTLAKVEMQMLISFLLIQYSYNCLVRDDSRYLLQR